MEKVIEKMMEAEFVGFALNDIQCRLLLARGAGLGVGPSSPTPSVTALDGKDSEVSKLHPKSPCLLAE